MDPETNANAIGAYYYMNYDLFASPATSDAYSVAF